MSDEDINLNLKDIKTSFGKVADFFKKKEVIIISTIIILAVLILIGVLIRVQNFSLLKDQATGQYIPLALDPFYWLREATTIIHTGGLPAIDPYRHVAAGVGAPSTPEIGPWVIAGLYELIHWFNGSVTIGFADMIYPVIFFGLSVIGFFFLMNALTKSKIAALISSAFLIVLPTYLYRTMAGFSDHNALGIFMFFLVLIAYTYSLIELNKKSEGKKESRKNIRIGIIFGVILGFLTSLTIASWGGISEFIPMIIPLGFFIFWIIKAQNSENKKEEVTKILIFYVTFAIAAILSGVLFHFPIQQSFGRIMAGSTSFLMGFVFLFIISDFLIIKYGNRVPVKNFEKRHIIWSLIISVFIGIIVISIHEGVISFLSNILSYITHPFGLSRFAQTVAEYRETYATDWISQTGTIFFWLFFSGVIALGINLLSGVKGKKRKAWFFFFWALMISGLLLGRFSSNSILNGTSFISKFLIYGGMALFALFMINSYAKKSLTFSPEQIALFSITLVMLIAANTAAYLMVIVSPFTCIFIGYLIMSLVRYLKKIKKREKDDLLKMFLTLAIIGVLIASAFSFNNLISASITQAKYTGPSANTQWQYAMQWVQENTPLNATFAHWWDYGYWVEYLGNRSTIADGGHFEGGFMDHMIGRYILTEPNANISLSFMKSNNVSYLLIDPSDLGKYPAYSLLGSGASGTDRYSSAPIMTESQSQTQTQGNTTIRVYQNVIPTDQDIIYNTTQGQIFIPQGEAYTIGVVLNTTSAANGSATIFSQPQMILYYNNQQMSMPLRYVYYNNHLIDFKSGYSGGVDILPTLSQSSTSYGIDSFGSMIYLSPKVFSSLFAQLYLMNDPLHKYPTITLAHSQDDPLIQSLKAQGFSNDFVDYGGNFYGPLKIWQVSYPNYILSKEQFTMTNGTYGDNFDNLTVTS